MIKKLIFCIFLILTIKISACLNYSVIGTDIHGKKIEQDQEILPYFEIRTIDKVYYQKKVNEDLQTYQQSRDLRDYLNYATSLVYLGRYQEAIKIFQEIEKKQPNIYEVASNLGTAYELTGDNKNALIWIKKALLLNTDSHHGSEWIHVKILEKKLGINHDDNILGFSFGNKLIPETNLSKEKLQDFINDLQYQLSERNQFVKPKEPIVARLYFELGNALAIHTNLEKALQAYHLSQQYGFNNDLINRRISHFQELIKENSDSGKIFNETEERHKKLIYQFLATGISILAGIILIIVAIVRYKKRKK